MADPQDVSPTDPSRGGGSSDDGSLDDTGDEDHAEEGDLSRIVTVPNLISFVRLLGIPLFVYLMFGADDLAWAAIVLGILGSTDWVDGWYARRFHQVTNLGKALDPTVDRLVMVVGIVCALIAVDTPGFRTFAVLVLVREVLVALWTLAITAANRGVRMAVTWWGKAGTFANYVAFPCFIMGASTVSVADWWTALAWCFAIPGLVLSYWAAVLYIPLGREALREGRAARADAEEQASPGSVLGKEQ